MAENIANWIVRWRFALIPLAIIIMLASASGIRFLKLTTDYQVFFSEDNPQLTAFETLQNSYTKNDNLLIVLAPKNHKVFTHKTLAAVEQLTEASWQIPYSLRVDSLSNYQHTYAEGDDLVVEDLYSDAQSLQQSDIQRVKDIALNEPLLVHRLINTSGDVTGVNVTINVPGENQAKEVPEVVEYARGMVEIIRADNPHLDVYLTGTVMMNNAFPEAARHDMRTLIPAMFLVVIVLLWFMIRTVAGVFASVLVIFFSILTAVGLSGWLGMPFTPPLGSAPTIILTLAVAHSVHILVSFMHYLGEEHHDKSTAMIESLRINMQPVALTSVTTAIGFLSMNFSDSPPYQDLGNMVAMGVIAAWMYSILFLPCIVMLLPVKASVKAGTASNVMQGLGEFVVRNRRWLLWINMLVVVILSIAISRNEINDQFVDYFDESIEFRRATDFVTDNLTGIYTIDYSLETGDSGAVSEPDMLNVTEDFANWYREQDGVIHVNVFTDIMKRLNMNLHEDQKDWYRIPDERELAAQYLLLYEMSLPYGLDLNNQINVDKSATRITVTVGNLKTNELMALEAKGRQWLVENAPEAMHGEGSSPAIMFSHITSRNIHSMLIGTPLALVFISVLLMFAFRSFKLGMLSMLPNLLPSAAAFGIWGLLVGEVGVSLSVVVSMTLGIVVDDTIHFISKYQRARREQGMNPQDSVRYAFSTVGTALWVTSAVLVAGFSVLAFSAFKMNAGMGLMSAITITIALVLDFLFLPPLLMKLEEKSDEKTHDSSADQQSAAA